MIFLLPFLLVAFYITLMNTIVKIRDKQDFKLELVFNCVVLVILSLYVIIPNLNI